MRCLRGHVVLAGFLAAGCGQSDNAGPGNDAGGDAPVDAFSPGDGGVDAAIDASGAIRVSAPDQSVYAGQRSTLAATVVGTGGAAAFAWTVSTVPAGSTLTTASLAGATTASVSLVPDVTGDYVLHVTATASGAPPASATATVHAFAAPVFYARANMDSNGGEVAVNVMGHDKSGGHAVACAINFSGSEADTYRSRTLSAAASTMDAWEAPAGQPARFTFSGTQSLNKDDAGNYAGFLIAGDTRNSCNQVPTTLRAMQAPSGAFGQPRFSPDGTRVAFLDPVGASFGVSTIGFDATGYRAIAPVYATPPASGDESTNIRPEWQDATHVGWPRPLGGGAWSVVVALDAAAAAPATYMTCTGATTPHHITFLADGSIVASYSPVAGAPTDIFVLKPDAAKACQVVHNLTKLSGANSRAHDFSVSPDQKTVAYLHYDATPNDGGASSGNAGLLYSVPVDGSSAPAPVGTPTLGRIGPRWIGGGSRLAWTRAGVAADGGNPLYADDVTVVLPDGGAASDLELGDGVSVIVAAAGPGGSCAMGTGRRGGAAALLVIASLALVRRRRSA